MIFPTHIVEISNSIYHFDYYYYYFTYKDQRKSRYIYIHIYVYVFIYIDTLSYAYFENTFFFFSSFSLLNKYHYRSLVSFLFYLCSLYKKLRINETKPIRRCPTIDGSIVRSNEFDRFIDRSSSIGAQESDEKSKKATSCCESN